MTSSAKPECGFASTKPNKAVPPYLKGKVSETVVKDDISGQFRSIAIRFKGYEINYLKVVGQKLGCRGYRETILKLCAISSVNAYIDLEEERKMLRILCIDMRTIANESREARNNPARREELRNLFKRTDTLICKIEEKLIQMNSDQKNI